MRQLSLIRLLVLSACSVSAFSLSTTAIAQTTAPEATQAALAPIPAGMSRGIIVKLDTAQHKITLKHGPIESLGMDPMTMTFRATPPSILNGLAVGQTVDFRADYVQRAYVVSKVQVVAGATDDSPATK